MTTFAVFEHKVFGRKVVKNGFSVGGCFFTLLWALFHKMWPLAAILFIWSSIALSLDFVLSNRGTMSNAMIAQFFLYHLPAGLIFGFSGNGFLRSRLIKQGYIKITEIEALSPEDALAKASTTSPIASVTQQTPAISQPPSSDLPEQIAKLNDLRQQGALTDEEYQSAKAKLLDLS